MGSIRWYILYSFHTIFDWQENLEIFHWFPCILIRSAGQLTIKMCPHAMRALDFPLSEFYWIKTMCVFQAFPLVFPYYAVHRNFQKHILFSHRKRVATITWLNAYRCVGRFLVHGFGFSLFRYINIWTIWCDT